MAAEILSPQSLFHLGADLPPKINIILAYENLSAALRATEVFTGLLRRTPGGLETRVLPWSFSTLSNPHDQAQATAAATRADLIVIVASGGSKFLPAFVKTWLQTCRSSRRKSRSALATLMNHARLTGTGDSLPLKTVRRLAKEAGCLFFVPYAAEGRRPETVGGMA